MKNVLLILNNFLENNKFIVFLFIPTLIFIFFIPKIVININWNILLFLIILLFIIECIKETNVIEYLAYIIILKSKYIPILYISIISLTVFISMFLTNDITLFIIIPFLMSIEKIININMSKILILSIIAVNIGSMLTPTGNPQNIYLWHQMNINFLQFIILLLPVFILLFLLLIMFVLLFSKFNKININRQLNIKIDKKSFFISIINLLLFIILVHTKFLYFLIIPFIIYAYFHRKLVKKYPLNIVIIFILIIMNINVLTYFFLKFFSMKIFTKHIFLSGIIISQLISNFPAAIFLSKISNNYKLIVFSVNIAGNGTIIASLANIIGIKLINRKGNFILFHFISISFLILSLILYKIILG